MPLGRALDGVGVGRTKSNSFVLGLVLMMSKSQPNSEKYIYDECFFFFLFFNSCDIIC